MGNGRIRRFLAWSLPATALVVVPVLTLAQDGGVLLTFGIEQSLRHAINPGLASPAEPSETTADTKLTFAAVTETRTERLAFSSGATLRFSDVDDFEILNPSAELSWRKSGASSLVDLSGFLRETDVEDVDFLLDIDEGGNPVITTAEGSGTQRQTGARIQLSFGEEAPFGGSLTLGLTDTAYRDTTDPSLLDSRATNAGLSFRLALNDVTNATLGLGQTRLKEDGSPAEDTTTLTAGLTRSLARGSLSLTASSSRTTDGTRNSISLGRQIELPNGSLSASLGITRPAIGDTAVTGALSWTETLPQGSFSLGVNRSVASDAQGEEVLATRLNVGYAQDLTPRLGMNLGASWQETEESATNTTTQITGLDASLRYGLTEDWGLNFGATHRSRTETGTDRAESNTVYLSVSRSFDFRP